MNLALDRPRTLRELTSRVNNLQDFGFLLREWIHVVTREDVSNRPAIERAIIEAPIELRSHFIEGKVADAYLAAYAEWIADQCNIERPCWVRDSIRYLKDPWFADEARASLLVLTPASFRQRNVYTIPEQVIKLRRGRPRVSDQQKREKAMARDRRYREKIREKLLKLRKLEELGIV